MVNGEVIWTSSKKIATIYNSLRNNIRREVGYRIIKLTLFPLDIAADGSLVWETEEVNCLAKAVAISMLRMRDLEGKVMGSGLIGRGFDMFPIKVFDYAPKSRRFTFV